MKNKWYRSAFLSIVFCCYGIAVAIRGGITGSEIPKSVPAVQNEVFQLEQDSKTLIEKVKERGLDSKGELEAKWKQIMNYFNMAVSAQKSSSFPDACLYYSQFKQETEEFLANDDWTKLYAQVCFQKSQVLQYEINDVTLIKKFRDAERIQDDAEALKKLDKTSEAVKKLSEIKYDSLLVEVQNWQIQSYLSQIETVLKAELKNIEDWKTILSLAGEILKIDKNHEYANKIKSEAESSIMNMRVGEWMKDGENKYLKGSYEDAINSYISAALEGENAEARYKLGKMYEEGKYKNASENRPNYAEAERWYLLAKAKGHDSAEIELIKMRYNLAETNLISSLTSRKNLELVWVDPGIFTMGSPEGELGRKVDETPHRVELTRGFWIGKYEITQEQYKLVMKIDALDAHRVSSESNRGSGSKYPVYKINWQDATNFCARLTTLLKENGTIPVGYKCTLPTEAQWEYACRAGSNASLDDGIDLVDIHRDRNMEKMGWYEDNSDEKTHPVGKRQPNRLGIYDMRGNVWEFCLDWYDKYSKEAVIDPMGPKDPPAGDGSERVIRGGSWNQNARWCRSAARSKINPVTGHVTTDTYGFRVVFVPE